MSEHLGEGRAIVNQYAAYSALAGLIPVPVLDAAAVAALELKMIGALSDAYKIPFKQDRGKAIIAALTGGVGAGSFAYNAGGRLLAGLPLIGPLVALATAPAFAYGVTYAVGRVFLQHFESGGTFLNFDLEKGKAEFKEHLEETKSRPAPAVA